LRTPDRLGLIPEGGLAAGPGASLVMAAFLHVADEGGRFHDAALGAWYAGRELATAVEETVHHSHRRLAASAGGFPARLQLRELIVTLDAQLLDLRGAQASDPGLYHPDDYAASQAFARERRWPFARPGEDGFIYDSVRRAGGQCVALFRPAAVPLPVLQGDHFEYVWNAGGELTVLKLTRVGRS
jgi:RES domain-containing protein